MIFYCSTRFDLIHFYFQRNPRVPCPSIPEIDFSHWREEATQCRVNGIVIGQGNSRKISPCTSCTCTKEGVRYISDIQIKDFFSRFISCFQAQCQSLKINNCPQLIFEFGADAVRRDNICKTQCSFALNSPGNGLNFDPSSDTLQAPSLRPFGQPNPRGQQPQQNPTPTTPINQPTNNGNINLGGGGPINPNRPLRPQPPVSQSLNAPSPPNAFGAAIFNNRVPAQPPSALPVPPGPPRPPLRIPNPPGPVAFNPGSRPPQPNPGRQPRPLFNFLPRLPNLSELFGL